MPPGGGRVLPLRRPRVGLWVLLAFVALSLLGQAVPLYTDWLWFQEVGFTTVFTTRLTLSGWLFMGLGGAVHAHFIGFIAPNNYLPNFTFQVWTMLIIGGAGNNRGSIVGAVVVWALWSLSGASISAFVPPDQQARASALQIAGIGIILCLVLLLRPRGLLGEPMNWAKQRGGG